MQRVALLLILLVLPLAGTGCGDTPKAASVSERRDAMLARAAGWLWSQQAEDGGWHSDTYGLLRSGQSLTPFVLDALLDVPAHIGEKENERIARAVAFIKAHVDDDGALGRADDVVDDYPNYASALAATVLARLAGDVDVLERLGAYLLRQQFQEAHGWKEEDPAYGAWGMGGEIRKPPHPGHLDLSMTRYVLEALAYQARDGRNEAYARAKVFLGRLRASDGGYFFSTVITEKNKAGPLPGGGFRAYGTTTADALLAMTAMHDDAKYRVAARDWLIQRHRVDRVPGFDKADRDGWPLSMLHYYRAASARCFQALGVEEAPAGRDWRADLVHALALEQSADGTFRNEGTLMKEDDPLIATTLALKALAATR